MKNKRLKLFAILLCFIVHFGCRSHEEWKHIFVKKGREYFKNGKYEEARQEFAKAEKIFPEKSDDIYEDLIYVYYQMKNWPASLEYLNKMLDANQNPRGEHYFLRADLILKKSGNYRSAIAHGYNQAIRVDPNNALYYQKRSEAYQMLGEQDLAEHDLETARKLNPKSSKL